MALTVAEVQKLLDGLEEKLTLRINSFIMGMAVPIKEAIEAHRGEILPQMALPAVKEERMSGTINLFNSTNGEIVLSAAGTHPTLSAAALITRVLVGHRIEPGTTACPPRRP